jgi:hypothetical protein
MEAPATFSTPYLGRLFALALPNPAAGSPARVLGHPLAPVQRELPPGGLLRSMPSLMPVLLRVSAPAPAGQRWRRFGSASTSA